MITRFLSPCLGWLVLTVAPLEHADAKPPANLKKQIAIIQAVGTEGTGNAEAAVAFRELARAKASALLPLLRAIEPSNPIARNWLRSAVEVIVERELAATKPLPFADLKAFLADRTQSPEARRLAFDLMLAIDRATAEAMVPGFLDDPSTELRRDAVELLISEGRKQLAQETGDTATATYRKALDSARDVDQIQEIAKALTNLKQQVDLPRHFGFLTDWQIIGPFHNNDRKGFAEEFPRRIPSTSRPVTPARNPRCNGRPSLPVTLTERWTSTNPTANSRKSPAMHTTSSIPRKHNLPNYVSDVRMPGRSGSTGNCSSVAMNTTEASASTRSPCP